MDTNPPLIDGGDGGIGVDNVNGFGDDLAVSRSCEQTLRELRAELAQTEHKVVQLKQAISVLEALGVPTTHEKGNMALSALSYADAARAVLIRSGRPLRVNDILTRMARGGRTVRSTAPYRTLYRVLREHPTTFENHDGEWTLARSVDGIEWPEVRP